MHEKDRLLFSFHLCLSAMILKGRIILIGGEDDAAYKNLVDTPWGADCEVNVVWRMSEWREGFDVFEVNGVDYRHDKKALWWLGDYGVECGFDREGAGAGSFKDTPVS